MGNSFVGQYGNVKECEDWTTVELQRFQALMLMLKSPELDDLYQSSDDRRALRGEEKMHRDGHCHEAVMWFVHHVPETVRNEVANVMALPLLPYTQHSCNSKKHEVCDEYLKQVSCQDCHQDAEIPVTV